MESPQEDEILKLGQAITDPAFRDAVQRDLDETLRRHGVDKNLIPQDVLETLTTLSPDELAVLAKVKGALKRADVSPHVMAEWV
jgi:hypothetical protein